VTYELTNEGIHQDPHAKWEEHVKLIVHEWTATYRRKPAQTEPADA
jgi:hypothetical protein